MDGTFAGANIVPSKAKSAGVRFRLASTESLTIVGSAGYYQAEQGNSAISISPKARQRPIARNAKVRMISSSLRLES